MSNVILTILLSTFFFLASSQCPGLESKEYAVENEPGILISINNDALEITLKHPLKSCSSQIMYCNTSDDGTTTLGVSIMCTSIVFNKWSHSQNGKTIEIMVTEITITNTSVTLSGTQVECPLTDTACATTAATPFTWTLRPIIHNIHHFLHFFEGFPKPHHDESPHWEHNSTTTNSTRNHTEFEGRHPGRWGGDENQWGGDENRNRNGNGNRNQRGGNHNGNHNNDMHSTFASFEDFATVDDSDTDDNDTVADNDLDTDTPQDDQSDEEVDDPSQDDSFFGQPRGDFQQGQGSRPWGQSSNNNDGQWGQPNNNAFNNPNFGFGGGSNNNWGNNNQDSNPWFSQRPRERTQNSNFGKRINRQF